MVALLSSLSCRLVRSFSMSRQSVQFCIENSEGPIYFRIGESSASGNNKSDRNESEKLLRICEKPQAYLSSFKQNFCFAKNIDQHFKLKNEIRSHLDETQSITSTIAYGPDGGDGDHHFEYGYLLSIPSDASLQSLLEKLKKTDLIGESPRFITTIINDNVFAKFSETGPQELVPIHLVPSPEVHPAYVSVDTNSVYHSIEKVYEVLSHFVYLKEVQELLTICEKYIKNEQKWREMLPLQASDTVIVVEGLDATGKSSLTTDLARELDGTVLRSPPNDISHLRAKFDSHPELLRRAYYALGNYAFAVKIVDLSKKGVVICDRFWNSTAAYAIATDVSVGGVNCLPPHGHNVFKWPGDLLKPDVVLLLTVGDEERKRRLVGRGSVKTKEEIRIEVSSYFRNRLNESYLRMQGPTMLKIDVNGTKEEVLEKTISTLRSHNII